MRVTLDRVSDTVGTALRSLSEDLRWPEALDHVSQHARHRSYTHGAFERLRIAGPVTAIAAPMGTPLGLLAGGASRAS